MMLSPIARLVHECRSLRRVLSFEDQVAFLTGCAMHAPEIIRTGKLIPVDTAMSRNLEVRYRGRRIALPLADIDALLAAHHDNATFGNLREMYANDCYLRRFRFAGPLDAVLDLGANRGLFSLIALMALDVDTVVGVEPMAQYEPVARLLMEANHCAPGRMVRYCKFVGSPSALARDPGRFISIEQICAEQKVSRFGLVKIDIEGGERDLFDEPGWLGQAENLTMELHHHFAGGLESIPRSLERAGWRYIATDQFGEECPFATAMFLYASRTGALIA